MPFFINKIEILIIVISLSVYNTIYSQSFDRIESIANLDVLSENNGVAVADFDQDSDLDIFVVAKGKDITGIEKTHSRLFRNDNNGAFTDVTSESGLTNLFPSSEFSESNPALDGVKYGASWGDYDNDGYPDLFLTYLFKVQLFHNNGDGTFTETTLDAGIDKQNNCWNTCATWFDYNNDSFLDLFVSDWEKCGYNTFYINNGDGTFENVTQEFGFEVPNRRSYLAFPFDINEDGWMDIYLTNDNTYPNELFVNNNGNGFSEQAQAYGMDNAENDMGIAIGDFNNDSFFDFYITTIISNVLLQNNGDNTFNNISEQENLDSIGWDWDTVFSDFDLDGDEDLFVVNGFNISGPQNNRFFKNMLIEGSGGFIDYSEDSNLLAETMSVGSTCFDYDNDGDLDILVTNNDRDSYFYENKTINFNESHNYNWLKIDLEGTISNRDAIGTIITLETNNGSLKRYYNGIGFLSQNLQPVHFGLGEETSINEIKIKWPSGLIETFQNFESNTILKFTEGQGYETISTQPSEKILGCTDPNSCTYNPEATLDDNSCEYLSSGILTGPNQSGFNQIETYTYTIAQNSTAFWTVENGEILTGQGTYQITVKWNLEETGIITVKEINDICESTVTEMVVALFTNQVSENISVARIWNEALLEAIRNDFARPNVHSRNLFHTSIALFDSWAIYDENARPYLIGNQIQNFSSDLQNFEPLKPKLESQEEAMSYAAYRLLNHRFQNSPGAEKSLERFDLIMDQLGYDSSFTSVEYENGNAAALGNYIAKTIIEYGFGDGSNETIDYEYTYYQPANEPLDLIGLSETVGITDPNRWQPLKFSTFVDQSGNLIEESTPRFLGPEWGNVSGFALDNQTPTVYNREGHNYNVFNDPGTPPQLNVDTNDESSDLYKWNFSLVSIWSSHLDPEDEVLWDISPKTIGNINFESFPESFSGHQNFYKEIEGGDISAGHSLNPETGSPYEPQIVPRADYARVLAEFWADGPDSETPPGHWFTILNYVNDHPLFVRKFNGTGETLSPLEWDVKAYFILGGTMHDAAISAWSIKGWYDYIRPISAIRYMCELGQSSDENLPNYHVGGIKLKEGFIELIDENDPLSGLNNENVGKVKLYAWRGHNNIVNATTDVAGVGWILAKDWWPYQRPSFVTPPFAGFVSGHSTFSRAAAEAMTLMTGNAFFPGGMGEFIAKKDEFLVFEKGPSVDVVLQWATYYDASDQTSLSRIWGGIHPPADDIPGRIIGEKIGKDAFNFAIPYFSPLVDENGSEIIVYPNPVVNGVTHIINTNSSDNFLLFDLLGRNIPITKQSYNENNTTTTLQLPEDLSNSIYILKVNQKTKLIAVKQK